MILSLLWHIASEDSSSSLFLTTKTTKTTKLEMDFTPFVVFVVKK
jgi:hypothetical protein